MTLAPTRPGPRARHAVLCVDDDENVLAALSRSLGTSYAVSTACSAKDALALIDNERFAVVVSDLRMPELDGVDLLNLVRERAPTTARILLTGHADLDAAIAAVNRCNIFRLLCKPCPPADLHAAVADAADEYARAQPATPSGQNDTVGAAARIAYIERSDSLTRLPNRRLLQERIATERERDDDPAGWYVLCAEVETMGEIVEALGDAGRADVVTYVASRLRRLVTNHDTVARLEEARFAVLSRGDDATARAFAAAIVSALQEPVHTGGHVVRPVVRVGIARDIVDGDVVACAEAALRNAKRHDTPVAMFDGSMRNRARRRLEVADDLAHALAAGQLELHYQPQVDMHDGSVIGAEALVRWRHPEQGLIGAADFVPAAARSGLIVALGDWVLQEACRELARWPATGIPLSVNVAPPQLTEPGFAAGVLHALATHRLAPQQLCIEVTEDALHSDDGIATTALECLREAGVAVHLDDFGV
ncbi:MAG: hypothetical protein QOI55_2338, partial [Actinomycetota bacterium]|nr:hypothetical protein [Actinomycetota bacterium]